MINGGSSQVLQAAPSFRSECFCHDCLIVFATGDRSPSRGDAKGQALAFAKGLCFARNMRVVALLLAPASVAGRTRVVFAFVWPGALVPFCSVCLGSCVSVCLGSCVSTLFDFRMKAVAAFLALGRILLLSFA